LAADLVARKVEVIATNGDPHAALAAKNATSTIPIVFSAISDPVALGLVASLARPGGNLTGVSPMNTELMPKRLELLSELVPHAGVIALLVNPRAPSAGKRRAGSGAREGGRAPYPEGQHRKRDRRRLCLIGPTASQRARRRPRRVLLGTRREQIVALASRHAVPAIYEWHEAAAAGGLISYGASIASVYYQGVILVGKLLNGAKPADLPGQQPTTFKLVVNLKTAKSLGLTIPPSILARANEVIE
jgi:putative ABC transport system substrate-binding protein